MQVKSKSILKYSLITLVIIILLLIASIVALVTLVNPNHFKPLIIKAVKENTGRQLSLPGNISWKIFPNIGLHVGQASLSNPDGFSQPDFMKLDAADISLQLLPLFHSSIVVDSLTINGLNLGLIQKGDQNNWTFNLPQKSTGAATSPQKSTYLALSSLILTNTTITYVDLNSNKHSELKNFDFNLNTERGGNISVDTGSENLTLNKTNFNFDNLVSGKINFVVQGFNKPQYTGDINLPEFALNQLLDKLDIAKEDRINKPLLNKFAISSTFKGDMEGLDVSKLDFNFGDNIAANTTVKVQNFDNPQYTGTINLPTFSLNKLLDGLNIAKTSRVNNTVFNNVAVQSKFSGTKDDINFSQTHFNFPNIVDGDLNLQVQNFDNPEYAGDINLPTFSLNKLLDGLNIAKASRVNKPLLNNFALQSKFSGTKDNISFNQTHFNFPNIVQGNLNLQVQNFDKPQYIGNINLPTFSLNNLLAQSGITSPKLPNKALLNKVAFQSKLAGGTNNINLSQIDLKLSNSTITGNLNVNSIKPIKFNENLNLDQAELSDFINTKGFKLPIKQAKFNGNLSLNGLEDKNYPSSLNAQQSISVGNLKLLGFSINNFIHQLDNTLTSTSNTLGGGILNNIIKGNAADAFNSLYNSGQILQSINNMKNIVAKAKAPGPKDLSQQTDLGTLQADVTLHNGIAQPTNFKLSGPSLKSNGQGSVNLNKETLNYSITTQLVAPQQNKIINQIIFPYLIQGKIADMNGSLDWGSIQKQLVNYYLANAGDQVNKAANQVIDQVKQKATENLQQGVQQGTDNLIKNIFGH